MDRKICVVLTRKFLTLRRARLISYALRVAVSSTLLLGLCLAGCSEKASSEKFDPADKGITVDAKEGPVTLSLTLSPTKPDTSAPSRLTIEAIADASVTLTLANYILALRETDTYYDYRIKLRRQETAAPVADGKLRWLMEYDLAFTLAGDYEFPPASVTFEDATIERLAHSSSRESTTLETESLAVTVVDTIDNVMSPEELASIQTLSPVELAPTWSRWWWLGPLLAVAGLIALALFLYLVGKIFPPARRLLSWLRRRVTGDGQAAPVVIIPAHIWARRALAALVSEDLLARGMVQPFYYRISDVMRGYIERRFDLQAPDMTTEEFLTTAGDDPRFPSATTTQLETFLQACDLVKYARMQPDQAQADQLVQAAENFVETTYQRESTVSHVQPRAAGTEEEVAA